MREKSSNLPIILTVILVIALCCLVICLILFASGATLHLFQDKVQSPGHVINQPIPETTPTRIISQTETPAPSVTTTLDVPDDADAIDTLSVLQQSNVPVSDPNELAKRLGGKGDIPRTYPDTNAPYQIGDSKLFWAINVDTSINFQLNATMRYLGDHIYFWIEDGVAYDEADLIALADTFDQEIYPTTRDFFGSEWSPGVDHDPRIHILYARGLGDSVAGYYSSADQLHPEVHQYSNAHEMFFINADTVRLWQRYIYGTLAHEYQHMIHWNIDKNEETWLNEGFSMLAELINGYDPGGFDHIYIRNTDLQLTDWGTEIGENGPHYGAAMLFTTYYYNRFGEEATKALVAHPKNGMTSIDAVLAELEIEDPLTGQIITSEDVFTDWAVANYLGDSQVADGRYYYDIYPDAPLASASTTITTCPTDPIPYTVAQFGVDYVSLACPGTYTLAFEGDTTIPLLPIEPYSGEAFFWSNMGDHSNMYLERQFDLTDIDGPVELVYLTWYDIEEDYDYAYVSASSDNQTWQILETTSCTHENPSGNSFGCGLNGRSDGWQEEVVDLSSFTGGRVTIRFDYVTDAAVNGDGLIIDDIRIDAIGYYADFEADDGGWTGHGFVRVNNTLPQFFRISKIVFGDQITVSPLILNVNNQAEMTFELGEGVDEIVLVISGTTPFTRQRANYRIEVR